MLKADSSFFMLYYGLKHYERRAIMSALDKMWVSFAGIAFLLISMGLIYLSRYKLQNGILKFIFALVAYILLILGFFIMIFTVFSGPTGGA